MAAPRLISRAHQHVANGMEFRCTHTPATCTLIHSESSYFVDVYTDDRQSDLLRPTSRKRSTKLHAALRHGLLHGKPTLFGNASYTAICKSNAAS